MKRLRLLIWIFAPLGMILLAWLFLQPPVTDPATTVDAVGVLILDPIDAVSLRSPAGTRPVLTRMAEEGLIGTIIPNGAVSMDDALLEICTGKNPRKLHTGVMRIDRETYAVSYRDIHDLDLMVLREIVQNARRPVRVVAIHPDGSRDERMLPPESSSAELTLVRIMDDGSDPDAYLNRIETHLATLTSDVTTWMIVCPMTRIPVTGSWNVNQWLETNHYLARTEDGGVDMTRTRVFYAGENEPGLRINRELTYARGIVPRIDYEGLRKTVATELRSVSVPGTGNTSPGNEAGLAMFTKLFAGEQIYINRTEGRFPDIVWEQSDPSVAVVTELHTVPPTRLIPGGWMLLYGSPFDHALQDTTRLDDLLAADVTPTVLYLLRLPVARDMDGRVLRPLMEATQHRSVPMIIDSYTVSDTLVDQGVMESSTEGNGTTRQ